jgi:DNA-binding MarR family transcriptional regulator
MNQGRAGMPDPARDSRVCADVGAEAPGELARALRIVKRLYAVRRQRDRAFGRTADVFRDPAWDMMLELFAAGIEGRKISVSSAAHVACIPQTTAIRLVDQLVARKLLRRVADPGDGRRTLLELTPMARDMMWGFLATLGPDQVFDVDQPVAAAGSRAGN